MAILFDWYENPVSPDQPKKKRFHPRIAYNGQVDTDEMRSKIQSRCTLNEVDVTAVLGCSFAGDGRGVGRRTAGAFGRHRLFLPHADCYGRDSRRHSTTEYENQTEGYPLSFGSEIEKLYRIN